MASFSSYRSFLNLVLSTSRIIFKFKSPRFRRFLSEREKQPLILKISPRIMKQHIRVFNGDLSGSGSSACPTENKFLLKLKLQNFTTVTAADSVLLLCSFYRIRDMHAFMSEP